MIDVTDFCGVYFEEVKSLPDGLISAIGHQDTANVLGVPMNRINVRLSKGDIAYVAQLQGGRLPEGATTLPEGFSFKFIKVYIGMPDDMKKFLHESIVNSSNIMGLDKALNSFFEGL